MYHNVFMVSSGVWQDKCWSIVSFAFWSLSIHQRQKTMKYVHNKTLSWEDPISANVKNKAKPLIVEQKAHQVAAGNKSEARTHNPHQ